ncbi:hypothetical protein PS928_06531 [Pseudomonas fluorescens]|jgi:hypothetical protein|uniref:Uncharacterized protein n=1 Tax=Pseudomonas fluorescens TaxID=294 RepID=A0A5E7VTZ3_PSEFL|nr:hypothetical protein PS928_06531 [Pseudomonas fluorescens]
MAAKGRLAFASVAGQINNSHIALGLRRALAIEQFALETLAKQVDGLAHFLRTLTTLLRQVRISVSVRRTHLAVTKNLVFYDEKPLYQDDDCLYEQA